MNRQNVPAQTASISIRDRPACSMNFVCPETSTATTKTACPANHSKKTSTLSSCLTSTMSKVCCMTARLRPNRDPRPKCHAGVETGMSLRFMNSSKTTAEYATFAGDLGRVYPKRRAEFLRLRHEHAALPSFTLLERHDRATHMSRMHNTPTVKNAIYTI